MLVISSETKCSREITGMQFLKDFMAVISPFRFATVEMTNTMKIS